MASSAIALSLVACALSLRAGASVSVPLSFDEMLERASLVVEGEVMRVAHRARAARGHVRVERHVSLDVTEVHRGPALDRVRFSLPGGRIGDRERVVVGAPTVHPHEEVIAFLEPRDGAFALVGLAQGLYRVHRLRDGRAFAVRDLRGLATLRGRSVEHGERESIPLGAFRANLRRALEERRR